MKRPRLSHYTVGALAILASAFAATVYDGRAMEIGGVDIATDSNGNIRVPDVDYRKDWTALGSWSVAAEPGTPAAKGIHAVYTQPESVETYRRTGAFPDGTVLLKELFTTTTQDMTTGTVSRANQTSGWFVMVKDSTDRFTGNKLWGDGWGWAYFDADDRRNTTSTNYLVDCKGCHIPAARNDWVYVQGYPVLKK